jgi:hypothetical protein
MGFKTNRAVLTIASGQSTASADIYVDTKAEDGQIYVGATILPTPSTIVSLSVEDGGKNIIQPINVEWYKRDGKGLRESAIPIDIPGGRNVKVEAKALANVGADTNIEVVFFVESNNY